MEYVHYMVWPNWLSSGMQIGLRWRLRLPWILVLVENCAAVKLMFSFMVLLVKCLLFQCVCLCA
jgi:hypothetical protein